jgi:hypothetical protein
MRAKNEQQAFSDQPHIFEASAPAFGTLTSSVQVTPEALPKLKASKIF